MSDDLKKIEYRHGMIESGMRPEDFPINTWRGEGIPSEIRKAINDENILDLGGVYGDRNAGDPVEYDLLRLVFPDNVIEIEVFNRAITLIFANDEDIRRIHRVLCKLRDLEK